MKGINSDFANNTNDIKKNESRISPYIVGVLLRRIRIAQNYTLLDLQKRTSIHQAVLLAFEVGCLEPSSSDIFGITKACKISIDSFYHIASNMSQPQVHDGKLNEYLFKNNYTNHCYTSNHRLLEILLEAVHEESHRGKLH